MYDFRTLSPLDFELLVRDLLQAETGIRFESFGPGRDMGIDFRFAMGHGDAIVQAKHYVDSTSDALIRVARKEAEKVKKLTPARYLLATSASIRLEIVSEFLIEWNGQPVRSIKTAFGRALALAGIVGKVTPHTLRHTAATWLMQAGVDKWEAAGFLGMSVEMIDRVYGHHHPDHLRRAALALGYRPQQSLAVSLAGPRRQAALQPQVIEKAGGGRSRSRSRTGLHTGIPG